MHGRKKRLVPPTAEEIKALNVKTQTYKSLINIIMTRKAQNDHSMETLTLIGKMLRNNPDVSTLWNYRREILNSIYIPSDVLSNGNLKQTIVENEVSNDADIEASLMLQREVKFSTELEEKRVALTEEELLLSADAIQRNPKCYGAWDYRRWCLESIILGTCALEHVPKTTLSIACSLLNKELSLCETFLKADERNFHCWSYRRYIVDCLLRLWKIDNNVGPIWNSIHENEMSFSLIKIQENFSNYSAYHHRSVYIQCMSDVSQKKKQIELELKIIENAMFTEPDDQSIWWYFQFILRWIKDGITLETETHSITESSNNSNCGYTLTEFMNMLEKQIATLSDLLGLEPDCKWCKVGLITVLNTILDISSSTKGASLEILDVNKYNDLKDALLDDLCVTDPMHIQHYLSQKQL